MRRFPSLETTLVVLVAHAFALGACGGPSEGARSPSPPQATPSESAAAGASDDAEADDTAPAQASEPEPTEKAPPAVGSDTESADAPKASAESAPETRKAPSKPASEANASEQLALELEKRSKAAKAQTAKEDAAESSAGSAAPAAPEASGYEGPDPCRATSFGLDRVREACDSGGRPAAKRVMKDAVTKAIATSQRLVCADCHSNQRDYALKPNALTELKRLLES